MSTAIMAYEPRNPIAALLVTIARWLDRGVRADPIETPEADVVAVAEALPPPDDDGILKPIEIARRAANLLWAQRGSIEVVQDYDEAAPGRERHSEYEPVSTVRVPGGIQLKLASNNYHGSQVIAPDGQKEDLGRDVNGVLMRAWTSIQAQAIVDALGLEDVLPADPEDDGTQPTSTILKRVGQAIGAQIERRAPVECTETWRKRYYEQTRDGKPALEGVNKMASAWMSLGEDVLLRVVRDYDSSTNKMKIRCAYVSHPVMGQITIPGEDVQKGLDRRKSSSLAEALGMAIDLPAHLPMPRGNAQAARVLRLCREAIAVEPDLVDAAGTPIRPLVDQHLPELMRRHAAAAAIAPSNELAAIDSDLMEGIDRVRMAVEEALSCSAVARRTALKSQLGFLALRHPDVDSRLVPVV